MLKTQNIEQKQKNSIQFTKKSFISVCLILLTLIIVVGTLTFVIPAGQYVVDAEGNFTGEFIFGPAANRLPIWRWFTAPFEVWASSSGITLAFLSLLLIIMGGAFFVIEKTGGMQAIVNAIIRRFHKFKYLIIWVTTGFFMLLAATFGAFEDALVLLPIILILAKAMGWDNITGMGMMLLAAGVGISATFVNYFSIGIASELADVNPLTGLWYRVIIWLVLWVITCLFVTYFMAKKAEKKNMENQTASRADLLATIGHESSPEERKKVRIWSIFYGLMLIIILAAYLIPGLVDFIMPIMAISFLIGGLISGYILTKSWKTTCKHFGQGALALAPAIIILMMSLSVKYIAEQGEILHTIFYYFSDAIYQMGPYTAIIMIFIAMTAINFFIPSASAQALLTIPLMTIMPITGISFELIILAFVLAQGFTDVFWPTSPVLLIGLSFSEISYFTWFKKRHYFNY